MLHYQRTRATILLMRQLSVLLRAGMPLTEALNSLEDFPVESVRRRLQGVVSNLTGGVPPAEAMARCPELFGHIPLSIWGQRLAPEALGRILADFADETEKVARMKQRMKRAFAYPLATLSVGLMVLWIMLVRVIPAFERMYEDFGSSLPGPTRALVDLSHHAGELAVGLFLLFIVLLLLWIKLPTLLHALGSYLPVLGSVLRRSAVYCFSRDLGLLMRLGIPWQNAVREAATGLSYLPFSRSLANLEPGRNLRDSLSGTKGLPSLFLQVIGVGERSGKVGEVLKEFAGYYERDVESAYFRLLIVTELLVLVGVALLIGWSVMAMYLPIFRIAGTVSG